MTDPSNKPMEDLGPDFEILEDLGDEFEILEDAGPAQEEAKAPAGTAAPAEAAAATPPAPGSAAAPATPGSPAPVTSIMAWSSLGMGLAVAGLLGPWASLGGSLPHGLFLAFGLWFLMRYGVLANRPQRDSGGLLTSVLTGLMLVYAGTRLAFAFGGNSSLQESFGWLGHPDGANMAGDAAGAWFTLLGALLVLAAPTLGKKKDAKLPPAPAAPEGQSSGGADSQFAMSLLSYLMVFIGLMMPWASSGQRGVDSLFGAITMVFVVMVLWAAWTGTWKLWGLSIVNQKLGLVLFVAPLESLVIGLFGLLRHASDQPSGMTASAWPPGVDVAASDVFAAFEALGQNMVEALGNPVLSNQFEQMDSVYLPEPFLVYAAGPLLVLIGSVLASWVLIQGTRQGMKMNQERKAAEIAARKASREAKKGNGDDKKAKDKKAKDKKAK